MGYLTTITFYNDAADTFRDNPQRLAEIIDDACVSWDTPKSYAIGCCANYIYAQRSRHASETTIYLHRGNCVTEYNPYTEEFQKLLKTDPDYVKQGVKIIERQVRELKKQIKKHYAKLAQQEQEPASV